MAALHWQDATLASAVSQTTEITLMGETQVAPLADVNEVIVVSTNLNDLISYSGAYKSELKDNRLVQTYPTVTINLSALMASAGLLMTSFRV